MNTKSLSIHTRKALEIQLGEKAGREIANLLQQLAQRTEELERTKVNVTPIISTDASGHGEPKGERVLRIHRPAA